MNTSGKENGYDELVQQKGHAVLTCFKECWRGPRRQRGCAPKSLGQRLL